MEKIDRLYRLIEKQTHSDASYIVGARATYYPLFTRVYVPNQPYRKLLPGMELRKQKIRYSRGRTAVTPESAAENIERSIRRSKKVISDYIYCNVFDLFVTFTFKANRQDVDTCRAKMANWLRNQQKRNGKFEYLIVCEFHNDGTSPHFHALLKGYTGKLKEAVNKKTNTEVFKNGRRAYSIPSYRSGYTTALEIGTTLEDQEKVGIYLRKYITKNMPVLFGKNRYWKSANLLIPKTVDNPELPKDKPPFRYRGVDRGIILDFEVSDE